MKKILPVFYRILCSLISIQIIVSTVSFASSYNTNEVDGIINRLLSYQKSQNNGKLYSSETVGTDNGDWFIIGSTRSGNDIESKEYHNEILNNVDLSQIKATDLNRISLCVSSSGGNPQSFGNSNLIADGIYNRGESDSLGKEGVIGWIWGLIALDSGQYSVPSNASYSRDDIIVEILRQQLNDGGFALSGSSSDASVTALAITALSPYITQNYSYSYSSAKSGKNTNKTVKTVVDESVATLSKIQNSDGTFSSASNTPNASSTAHTVIGLCSVGINPSNDSRFVKSGNSAVDGLMKYQLQSGGFTYSFSPDADKPNITANTENSYASSQALLALSAYKRLLNNQRRVFDFASEFSENTSNAIKLINKMLNQLSFETVTIDDINQINQIYNSLSANERSYIYNYSKLIALSESAENNSDAESLVSTDVPESTEKIFDTGTMAKYQKIPNTDILSALIEKGLAGVRLHLLKIDEKANNLDTVFTDNDRKKFEDISNNLSTKHYYTVLNLINKIEKCAPFEDMENIKSKLYTQKTIIETLISEIEDINSSISENLLPFDKVSISDRKLMHSIADRIAVLSDYDKNKIKDRDEFEETLNRLDTTHTTIIISIVAIQLLVTLSAIIMFILKKK